MNYYFVALLAICTAYALAAGGAPERIGATVYALACTATYAVLSTHSSHWRTFEFGVFLVDVVVFAFFCVLALRANRFWPIWVSALLGLGVLGHLARWFAPDMGWWVYAVALTIWSYPILFLLALGTWCHQQRVIRFGDDKSWAQIH